MAVDDSLQSPRASAAITTVRGRRGDLVASGAELVGVSERFYGLVFVGAIGFVGLAALAALVLLPTVRFSAGAPVAAAAFATGLIVLVTPIGLWRARTLYCALRRRPALQLGLVLVSALLIADPRVSSELWWPSCAILMALAIVAPVSRALAYCALALGANVAGHIVAADLDETPPVEIIGLWIGYPLWVAMIAVVTDRLVAYLVRLNATTATPDGPMPPRRVDPSAGPPPDTRGRAASSAHASALENSSVEEAIAEPEDRVTDRLTARELQVVALLADGLRYREVAACLSISERQVQRHVANAIARLGLHTPYELTALAITEAITRGRGNA